MKDRPTSQYRVFIARVLVALLLAFGWVGCIDDPFQDGNEKQTLQEQLAAAIDAPKPTRSHESRKAPGVQCFSSFRSFKISATNAGRKPPRTHHWHHIVEQHDDNKARFGERLQCTDNLIAIPYSIHRQITGFYNSKQEWTNEKRVRDVIKLRSFEKQYLFGIKALRDHGVEP